MINLYMFGIIIYLTIGYLIERKRQSFWIRYSKFLPGCEVLEYDTEVSTYDDEIKCYVPAKPLNPNAEFNINIVILWPLFLILMAIAYAIEIKREK